MVTETVKEIEVEKDSYPRMRYRRAVTLALRIDQFTVQNLLGVWVDTNLNMGEGINGGKLS